MDGHLNGWDRYHVMGEHCLGIFFVDVMVGAELSMAILHSSMRGRSGM